METIAESNPGKRSWLERWFLLKAGVLAGVVGGGLPGVLLGAVAGWLFIGSADIGGGVVTGVKWGFFVGAALGLLVGVAWSWRLRMNPLTLKKVERFRSIRRGFWSYVILMAAFIISIFGEAFVGNRALLVKYNGSYDIPFLPFLSVRTGQDFGLERDYKGQSYKYEVNYLELRQHFEREGKGNWVLLPPVPFRPGKMHDLPHRGRYVRVTLRGENRTLGLDGFKVIDHNSTYGVTMGAELSSTAVASDGQPGYLTAAGTDPWIELDMGGPRYVDDVRLRLPAKGLETLRKKYEASRRKYEALGAERQEHEALRKEFETLRGVYQKLRAEWMSYTVQLLDEKRAVVWEITKESNNPPAGADKRIRLIRMPGPPDAARWHYLGTDDKGRDILAQVFYGFRIAMIFALGFVMMVYLIGVTLGCLMGYFGGWVDLIGQRGVEIWQNIPYLYMVIIVAASIHDLPFNLPDWFRIAALLAVMVLFSWTSMTYYMRTAVYREKARDYVAAAQLLGASTPRVLFNHLMPNTISTMVTFMPFIVATAIISVTALDFLGLGLPLGTPSWGALLRKGVDSTTQAPWIVLSPFGAMVTVLTLVTFIGEAVREAFDPKKFTTYE